MKPDAKQSLLTHASRCSSREIGDREVLKDSLNVNKLLLLIRYFYDDVGVELDVNSFYIWQTIHSLAKAVERNRALEIPKLLTLKEGDPAKALVVYAGGVNCFLEIKSVLEGIDYDGVIYGMCLTDFDRPHGEPASVADEVEASLDELARRGVTGQVNLLGYSFGGVFALELARKLRETGRDVGFVGLIDTPQNEHAWPLPVWLGFVAKRIRRKLKRLTARRSSQGSQSIPVDGVWSGDVQKTFLHRLKPLVFRFLRPDFKIYPELAPEWVGNYTPDYARAGRQLLRMKGLFRPKRYDGKVVFYRALGGSPIDCDPKRVWPRYLPNAEWVDIKGNHLSAVVGRNGVALGENVGGRLRALDTVKPPSAAPATVEANVA
ncbi:thioesterase domain-containing protein [Roseibium aggregatum]|uniref:Thioesterase domain-containing protein n=1 Tax=Roseibium aggregatum TaxID=187304 RepID=A0A939EB14_9HYPH|nr:thioesterase domain-containing protein [Roseibium aggregatum]MBN9669902.1 hypothetical protein [Roseibium aggregatum]